MSKAWEEKERVDLSEYKVPICQTIWLADHRSMRIFWRPAQTHGELRILRHTGSLPSQRHSHLFYPGRHASAKMLPKRHRDRVLPGMQVPFKYEPGHKALRYLRSFSISVPQNTTGSHETGSLQYTLRRCKDWQTEAMNSAITVSSPFPG